MRLRRWLRRAKPSKQSEPSPALRERGQNRGEIFLMTIPSADRWLPKLVLSPTLAASLVFVYGFILITIALSFTESRLLPNWEWAGLAR